MNFPLLPSLLVLALAQLAAAASYAAPGDVLTQGYDANRTGAQRDEKILNPANVGPATFGKITSLPVDGYVHAQPLIVTGMKLKNRASVDIAVVATGNNSVFAFDVTGGGDQLLWNRQLGVGSADPEQRDIGIVSTPVIDRDAATLYVVTGVMAHHRGVYRLHAIDLRDGTDTQGGAAIEGSVMVDDQPIAFEPTDRRIAVQRAALALANGKVIVSFGGDYFEGWVFAFDASNLRKPPAAFCTTCTSRVQAISKVDYLAGDCTFIGPAGGIWQSGRGPVVDERGLVYFFTGNKAHIIKQGCPIPEGNNACAQCQTPGGCTCSGVGQEKVCRGPDTCIANESRDRRSFDTNEALVQLDPQKKLEVAGWFRPENWNATGMHGLEFNDLDLGSSGPLLIPGTSRLIGGGKDGVLYLLDTKILGTQILSDRAAALQSFAVGPLPDPPMQYYRHILGGPILWSRPKDADASRLFIWRTNDVLRGFRVTDRFVDCALESGAEICRSVVESRERIDHHPGGVLALSADGDKGESAIVWAYTNSVGNGPGKLMAYAAIPAPSAPERLREIWDSDMCPGDAIDFGSTFATPTVSNGRVYVATGDNRVEVYGLLGERSCEVAQLPETAAPLNNF